MHLDIKICSACGLEVHAVPIEATAEGAFGYVTHEDDPNTIMCNARDRKRYHIVDGKPATPWIAEL